MDCSGVAKRVLCPWNSPGKNTGVGHHSLFQRIFSTQESNLGLLHCRQIFFFFFLQSDPLSDEENYIFSGVGSYSLLQSIFSTQESNPGLLHCRQIFLHSEPPSHQENYIFSPVKLRVRIRSAISVSRRAWTRIR